MAADAWRAIVALGDRQMVLEALLRQYAVKGDALRADLEALLENLLDRGLLTDDPHE
jgi:hypothetical protein